MAARVDEALECGEAAICGPVLTELTRGLRSRTARRKVVPLLDGCHWLEQPGDLWQAAGDLGAFLSARGANVKTLDLLIATFAITHSAPLVTNDSDFSLMKKAGVELHIISG